LLHCLHMASIVGQDLALFVNGRFGVDPHVKSVV